MPLFQLWFVMCSKPALRKRWLCQEFKEGSVQEKEMQEAVGCACKWCAPWITLFYSTIAMTLIWASYNVSGQSSPQQEQIYFGLGIFFAIVCLLGILQYAVWAGIKGSRCIPLPASSTAGPNASDKKKDEDDLISIETGSSARAGSNSDGDNGGTFESVVVVGGTDSVETPIGKGGSGPNASQRPTGAGCASDPGNDHSSVHVSSSDASSLHSEGVSTATNAL